MTPEALEALVIAGDVDGVVAAVIAAPESDRRAAGPRMVQLRKAHGDWPSLAGKPTVDDASLVALLGTGSAAQIAGGRRMARHALAGDVLRARPRALLEELVPWLLERLGWSFVRAMVRDGTIDRPADDAYTYGMLSAWIDAPSLVRDDPGLLDHEVWRLFEVEGTGDHSLADHDKYCQEAATWSRTLVDLAGTRLDRDRLLEASLAALERDFPQFRAGWFSRFHEALGPTPAERAARVDAYLRLLRSPIGPTVTLAVDALEVVQRDGALDGERLLAHLPPAAGARAAGTARTAVRLADRAVAADDSLAGAAVPVVAAGLAHASSDVQRAALGLLERVAGASDVDLGSVADRRGDVAASLRGRFDAVMGAGDGTVPSTEVVASAEPPTSARPATAVGAVAAPASRDPFSGLVPVSPLASLTELVEVVASVLEREGPPDDLERVLDGVQRHAGDRPPDFERVVKAVRTRATKRLASRPSPIAGWFAGLVLAWTDGTPLAMPDDAEPSLPAFLAARVAEVARLVADRRAGTLLALPTVTGGWIEPMALVERLLHLEATGGSVPDHRLDLAQALLRLLPVRREEALAAAATITGEAGEAVRHALGGNAAVGGDAALWAAAARARNPDRDDPAVVAVHPGLGPDAALAGRYALVVRKGRWWRTVQVDAEPPAVHPRLDIPTGLACRTREPFGGGSEDAPLVAWLQTIWPGDRRAWFAASAGALLDNIDWDQAAWENRGRLEPLFEPWTPVGREGAWLLAVALQAKEPGERGLAVDAFAAALDEGRLAPAALVTAMGELSSALEDQPASTYPITLFRPARLAASLREVASRSTANATAAHLVAGGALSVIARVERPEPVPPAQLPALLRLLVELSAEMEAAPGPGARPGLEALAARGGETGRLARDLLGSMIGPREGP